MKPRLVALALGLVLIFAGSATAQIDIDREPCVTGHRFGPGPIVNGHRRQPTPAEIEARMRKLQAQSMTANGACSSAPRNDAATKQRSPRTHSPYGVLESEPPSRGTE